MKLWRKYCTNLKSENTIETFLQCDENVFPTVDKLLKYLITLPVTKASVILYIDSLNTFFSKS